MDFEKITSGSGYYTIESSDESIATATIKGNSITITAASAGNATITVTDTNSGQTATIEVTVTAPINLYPDNHPHMIDLGLFHTEGSNWDFFASPIALSVRPVISITKQITLPESSSNVSNQPVFNIYGIKVADKADNMNTLHPGIYIVNGKKIVIK